MKRLQFELSERRVDELDGLVERTELKTRVQLINTAITLFEWAVREREAGRIIASLDEKRGRYKEIEMPGFPVLDEHKDALDVILGQLQRFLETSEQEDAFATLADSLTKGISGSNSKHPEPARSGRFSQAGMNRKNAGMVGSQAVEESETDPMEGRTSVYDTPDSSDQG